MSNRALVVGKGSWTRSKTHKDVYYIRHSMGKDPSTGKYRYSPRRKVIAKNKGELRAALEAYKAELNNGTALKKTSQTVGQYAQEFHELRAGTMGSPLSYKREALEVREIQELFGDYGIRDLSPAAIRRAYAEARADEVHSESELHKIHSKLSQIMRAAVSDELIPKNPCDAVSVPRPKGRIRNALSLDDARRLVATLSSSDLDAHIIGTQLLLDTGMRRGEMLGLTWGYVDLEARLVTIREQFASDKQARSPKSASGVRTISLSPAMADRLGAWMRLQSSLLEEVGLEQKNDTPVVHALRDSRGKGRARVKSGNISKSPIEIVNMDPNNYGRWFREWCSDNGFGEFEEVTHYVEKGGKEYARGRKYKGLTPHMLRHTQATLLIGEGVDIKTVSNRLGHSTIQLTLDQYSHAIAAKDRGAADRFGELLS